MAASSSPSYWSSFSNTTMCSRTCPWHWSPPLLRPMALPSSLLPQDPENSWTSVARRPSSSIQSPRRLHRTVLLSIRRSFSKSASPPMTGVFISYLLSNTRFSHFALCCGAWMVASSPRAAAQAPQAPCEKRLVLEPSLRSPSARNPCSPRSQFWPASHVPYMLLLGIPHVFPSGH